MEVFSRFWLLILCFVLIFLCPLYLAMERKELSRDVMIVSVTESFLDNLRYSGYIDKGKLNGFLTRLSGIGEGRKVEITHRRRVVRPELENGEVKGTSEFYLEKSYEEIKAVLEKGERYDFSIGDEAYISVTEEGRRLSFFGNGSIEMGGMIENEPVKD